MDLEGKVILGIFGTIAVLVLALTASSCYVKKEAFSKGYSQVLTVVPGGTPQVLWMKIPMQQPHPFGFGN